MSCYLLQEDGVSRFILEEANGFLILEQCAPVTPSGSVAGGQARHGRRRRFDDTVDVDEEDALAVILVTV